MLRTSSLIGPVTSGFVPFSSGAPVDALADRDVADAGEVAHADFESAEAQAAEAVARAAAPDADAVLPAVVEPWLPASSARIRVVEGAVLAAMCAYFGWGLLRTLAGF